AVPVAEPAVAAVAVGVGAPVAAIAGPGPSPSREASPVRVSPMKPRAVGDVESAYSSVPDTADEPPAPLDAVPLPASPVGAGTITIGFEEDVPMDRLLLAIESVTQAIIGHPGPLPVVINLPVAGATRRVRLPHTAAWDERVG